MTFLVGMNDVIEIYRQFPAQNRESLIAEAKARGTRLADLINRIANANGRVIVSTIYDMGLTPFALMEKENRTDVDRAVLLDDLSQAFNTALRVRLLNDGRLHRPLCWLTKPCSRWRASPTPSGWPMCRRVPAAQCLGAVVQLRHPCSPTPRSPPGCGQRTRC